MNCLRFDGIIIQESMHKINDENRIFKQKLMYGRESYSLLLYI